MGDTGIFDTKSAHGAQHFIIFIVNIKEVAYATAAHQ